MYKENYKAKGIQTLSLDDLYESLKENSELPEKSHGFMYIIRSVDEQGNFTDERCKIGKTRFRVQNYIARRVAPRTPYPLKIVGMIRGREWEKIFHIRYRKYHLHHEWFTFDNEMLEFIRLLENNGYQVTKT